MRRSNMDSLDVAQAMASALGTINKDGPPPKVVVSAQMCEAQRGGDGGPRYDPDKNVLYLPRAPIAGLSQSSEHLLRAVLAHRFSGHKYDPMQDIMPEIMSKAICQKLEQVGVDLTTAHRLTTFGDGDESRALHIVNGLTSAAINKGVVTEWPGYEMPVRIGWRGILRRRRASALMGKDYHRREGVAIIRENGWKSKTTYDLSYLSRFGSGWYGNSGKTQAPKPPAMPPKDRDLAIELFRKYIYATGQVNGQSDGSTPDERKLVAKALGYAKAEEFAKQYPSVWDLFTMCDAMQSSWRQQEMNSMQNTEPVVGDYGTMVGAKLNGIDLNDEARRFEKAGMPAFAAMCRRVEEACQKIGLTPDTMPTTPDDLKITAARLLKELEQDPPPPEDKPEDQGEGDGGEDSDEGEQESEGGGGRGKPDPNAQPDKAPKPSQMPMARRTSNDPNGSFAAMASQAALDNQTDGGEAEAQGGDGGDTPSDSGVGGGPDQSIYYDALVIRGIPASIALNGQPQKNSDDKIKRAVEQHNYLGNIDREVSVLAQVFRQAIRAPSFKDDDRHHTGRFDVRQIARAKSGNSDVFTRRAYRQGDTVSVGVLIDASGSMDSGSSSSGGNRRYTTARAARIILHALAKNNMDFGAWYFTTGGHVDYITEKAVAAGFTKEINRSLAALGVDGDKYIELARNYNSGNLTVKDRRQYGEDVALLNEHGHTATLFELASFGSSRADLMTFGDEYLLNAPAMGGTPTDVSMAHALKELSRRETTRKLLFVLTDGGGGDPDTQRALCKAARSANIDVIAIGLDIGQKEMESQFSHFPKVVGVNSADSFKVMAKEIGDCLLRSSRREGQG